MATAKLVQKKKELFLSSFAELGSITAAAKASKVQRNEHYRWLETDEDYAVAFQKAQEVAADALEDEAVRRATVGTEKPVFQNGRLVGKIREFSDTLLIFLLKGARPTKYRDKFIAIPAKASDGKTPDGVVWVGSEESSTESAGRQAANSGSTN